MTAFECSRELVLYARIGFYQRFPGDSHFKRWRPRLNHPEQPPLFRELLSCVPTIEECVLSIREPSSIDCFHGPSILLALSCAPIVNPNENPVSGASNSVSPEQRRQNSVVS